MKNEEVRTQVRIPAQVHAWIAKQAKVNNRSMNGQMVEFFTQAMKQAEKGEEIEGQQKAD